MALTAAQTTAAVKLGVAAFGAPISTYTTVFEAVLNSAAPFGGSIENTYTAFLTLVPPYENVTDSAFSATFVDTLLGDTVTAEAKAAGVALVETLLAQGLSRGAVAVAVIDALADVANDDATWGAASARLENRVAVAEYYTTTFGGTETGVPALQAILTGVGATTDVSTPEKIVEIIQGSIPPGEAFSLTNGTDIATANIFNALMVYTPNGGDRILSLQDEDVLTGTAGRTDNTLNATIGQVNADEGTSAVVTPTLKNIQVLNFDWTGNTKTVDVRYADAVTTVNVNKITSAADDVVVQNISTPAANLRVANANNADTTVQLNYLRGVLAGTADVGNIALSGVLANSVKQDAMSSGAGVEGFETVNLSASNSVELQEFSVNQMQNLNITGSGLLDLVSTKEAGPGQYTEIDGGKGIANPGSIGLRSIDASAFTGELNLDITASGQYNDPANSGKEFFTTVKGGTGNDVFWAESVAANAKSKEGEMIDGGEGVNTLKIYNAGIAGDASIMNIQTLELRSQAGAVQTVDFDAFRDTELTKVLMRSEDGGVGEYVLNDIGADLASGGGLVLRHSSDAGAAAPIVRVNVKADTSSDTVAVTVENDRNTGTTFDYTIDADVVTPTGLADDKQGVENLTINDNDTESNVVTLGENDEHTGTVTLTGGADKQTFTVVSQLFATTVDASTQLSDLRLTVGNTTKGAVLNQTIKLGQGDDILTFADVDSLDGNDTVTDAGGVDTVRAAFSKDPASVINLTDIEKFHIAATNNVTLDMAKASTVTELALLSDVAVDGDGDLSPSTAEPFNLVGVDSTKVITLKNTALETLNFFGDNDTDDVSPANESQAQVFNGVTLENNSKDTLTVAINSSLDPDLGATSYTTGQLTTHGVKTMTVTVGNEVAPVAPATVSATVTNIKNIWDRDLETFTASTKGSMTLGTVSGNALGNNIKTFDVSAVQGDFTADVVALGDAAVVTLAAGKNTFNALGSSGKGVTITSFGKADVVTGTSQDDTINSGAGNDTVNGDRGNNVMSLGAGDDVATAKDGNNTVAFGTGTYETATINDTTGLDATKATNVFTADGSAALISIDADGVAGLEVEQMIAVGDGSSLRVEWTGATLNTTNALLDGTKAQLGSVLAVASHTGGSGADFVIADDAFVATFNGGAGNDVLIVTDAGARTFNGGAGNDAFVGNAGYDIVTGGVGADRIVLTATGAAAAATGGGDGDRVIIADGDSTVAAWDQVYGFAVGDGAANSEEFSALDLVFTTIAANTAGADGTNSGNVKSHAITNGLVTFDDADVFAASVVVGTGAGQLSLTEALAYLTTNLNGSSATVAFNYDRNGDGAVDDTIVFQDGAADTVVQLVGTVGTSLFDNPAAAGAAGSILIV